MERTTTIKRGDIYWIEPDRNRHSQIGESLERGRRPGIVVSNDKNNMYAPTYEIVFVTSSPKKDLPTHTMIRSTRITSTALCEQITTVGVEAIGDYYGHCTDEEMRAIDTCILISLGIDLKAAERTMEEPEEYAEEEPNIEWAAYITRLHEAETEREAARAERDLLQKMYDRLLKMTMKA